jgi:hypothetical protein
MESKSSEQYTSRESRANYASEEQVLKTGLSIRQHLKLEQDSEGFKLHHYSEVAVSSIVLL